MAGAYEATVIHRLSTWILAVALDYLLSKSRQVQHVEIAENKKSKKGKKGEA